MAIEWKDFTAFELAKETVISQPWLMVVDLINVTDSTHIRIKGSGSWQILPELNLECGADGIAGLPLAADALTLASSPPGCLIGRFGGSSAGLPVAAAPVAGETQPAAPPGVFAIGVNCLIAVPADFRGPLFASFNVAARPVTIKTLKVEVAGARLP